MIVFLKGLNLHCLALLSEIYRAPSEILLYLRFICHCPLKHFLLTPNKHFGGIVPGSNFVGNNIFIMRIPSKSKHLPFNP